MNRERPHVIARRVVARITVDERQVCGQLVAKRVQRFLFRGQRRLSEQRLEFVGPKGGSRLPIDQELQPCGAVCRGQVGPLPHSRPDRRRQSHGRRIGLERFEHQAPDAAGDLKGGVPVAAGPGVGQGRYNGLIGGRFRAGPGLEHEPCRQLELSAQPDANAVVLTVEHQAATPTRLLFGVDDFGVCPQPLDRETRRVLLHHRVVAVVAFVIDDLGAAAGFQPVVDGRDDQLSVAVHAVGGHQAIEDQAGLLVRDLGPVAEAACVDRRVELEFFAGQRFDDVQAVEVRRVLQPNDVAHVQPPERGQIGRRDLDAEAIGHGRLGRALKGANRSHRGRRRGADATDVVQEVRGQQDVLLAREQDLSVRRGSDLGQCAIGRHSEAEHADAKRPGNGDHHPRGIAQQLRAAVGQAFVLDVVLHGRQAILMDQGLALGVHEFDRALDQTGHLRVDALAGLIDRAEGLIHHLEDPLAARAKREQPDRRACSPTGEDMPPEGAALRGRGDDDGEKAIDHVVQDGRANLGGRLEERRAGRVAEVIGVGRVELAFARDPGFAGRAIALAAAPIADFKFRCERVGQAVEDEPIDQQVVVERLAEDVQVAFV